MDASHQTVSPSAPPSKYVVAAIAGFAGVIVAGALMLWMHYGTAVFQEMILAGIAYCF